MGNGRWGRSLGKRSEKSFAWIGALAAISALLMAGIVVVGIAPHHYTQHAISRSSSTPIPLLASLSNAQRSKPNARAILGQLPLIFEPNQGQTDPRVKFLAHGSGYSLFLDSTGAALTQPGTRQFIRMKLVGANPAATTAGSDPLPGRTNYLIGNDPRQWHRGIPQFGGVKYASVYPGIDLIFYGNQGRLEYDFRVAPGADASLAELQFEGASKVELSGGDLMVVRSGDDGFDKTGLANENSLVRLRAPRIYQLDGDRRQPVAGRFILHAGNCVGFEVGPYDRSRELIIDPVLDFSTYFGGSGAETSPSVAVNGDGFIYIVGSTTSPQTSFVDYSTTNHTSFPSTLSITSSGPSHIFVAKINPANPSVVYETFLGGSGTDTSVGVGVDNGGNVYFAGNTSSTDFPISGTPYQGSPETKTQCTSSPTCTSLFVSVLSGLDPTGATLTYSTFISGNGDDQASATTIDAKGDVFLTGTTTSTDTATATDAFPATLLPIPYQSTPKAGSTIQFFVTKLNTNAPSVGGIQYSTYFGGGTPTPAVATGGGIAVDSNGNIYFSGTTNFYNSGLGTFGDSNLSEDFPILNAYQPCLDTPPPTVLANQNPCSAPASPFPTDAFVAKINPFAPAGTQLLFSTYLGGTGTDSGTALAIDSSAANIFLAGSTNSNDFVIPIGIAPFQSCLNNPGVTTCPTPSTNTDAYVARMTNPAVSNTGTPVFVALTYFSYLGGSGNDSALAITVDSTITGNTLSDALVTGATSSPNFPFTAGAIQSTLNGTQNAFFAHIDTTTVAGTNETGNFATYFGGSGSDRGTGIAVDQFLNTYFVGDTSSPNLQLDNPLPGPGGNSFDGSSDAFVVKLGPANDLCVTCVLPVLSPTGFVAAGNSVAITFTVSNEGLDPATGVTITGSVPAGVTFNSATAGSGSCSAPVSNSVVCTIPSLQAGATSPVAFSVTPNSKGNYSANITVANVNNTSTNITTSAPFQAADFSMTLNPAGQTVVAGNTASYTVQINPDPVFVGSVSLSCSSLPSGATPVFTNTSLTPNGSSVSSILKITTTAQPVTTVSSGWRRPFYALWMMLPGMAWLGLGRSKRRGMTSRVLGLLALSLLFGLVLLQPSCSGTKTPVPVSGTPSGTYTLKVTATSGSFTSSQVFQLTVTP